MKKSKQYSVIASRKRLTLLGYAGLWLLLAIACVSAVSWIINNYNLSDHFLTIIMAVIFVVVGLWMCIKFLIQAVNNALLAGDNKYLYINKRRLPWVEIEQFLFSEEVQNNKKVYFVTVLFDKVSVNASFSFKNDKQPLVGKPVTTKNSPKNTVYRVRLDDIEQPVEVVEQLLYRYLDKYGKE